MAIENLYTYDLVSDTGSNMLVSPSSTVTWELAYNERNALYKDFGAGYFGNFVHAFQTKITDFLSAGEGTICVWSLSNAADPTYGVMYAAPPWLSPPGTLLPESRYDLAVRWYLNSTPGDARLELVENEDFTNFSVRSIPLALNTDYYLTVEKSFPNLVLKIYSDAARTVLVDTISLVLHVDRTFRYLYGLRGVNGQVGGGVPEGENANYDLNFTIPTPAPGPQPSVQVSAATLITESSARLNGIVTNDQGQAGEVRFEYGNTRELGRFTPWFGGYRTGMVFYADISGLTPGQGYYFRAWFRNQSGIVSSTLLALATLSPSSPVAMSLAGQDLLFSLFTGF